MADFSFDSLVGLIFEPYLSTQRLFTLCNQHTSSQGSTDQLLLWRPARVQIIRTQYVHPRSAKRPLSRVRARRWRAAV